MNAKLRSYGKLTFSHESIPVPVEFLPNCFVGFANMWQAGNPFSCQGRVERAEITEFPRRRTWRTSKDVCQGYLGIGVNARDAALERQNQIAGTDKLDLLGIASVLINKKWGRTLSAEYGDARILRDLTRHRKSLVKIKLKELARSALPPPTKLCEILQINLNHQPFLKGFPLNAHQIVVADSDIDPLILPEGSI